MYSDVRQTVLRAAWHTEAAVTRCRKKNPISYQENFFTSVRGQNSAGQGSEQSGGAVFPGIKHDHLQRGFPA